MTSIPMRGPTLGAQRARLIARCRGMLTLGTRETDGAELVRIGQWCQQQGVAADKYGEGELVQGLETKVAALLGFEAACFMPTGTMGQLVLLRLLAERGRSRAMGIHPTSHHLRDENSAVAIVDGLHPVLLCPEARVIRGDDVRKATEPLGVVSVEMPNRWTGQLQTWDELEDLKAACREGDIPLHVDGARLWECATAYERPLAEICKGTSSVYVSLYKTLGALGGAIVCGPEALMRDARLWRHRLGGNVFRFFPYAASAAMRIDDVLERIPTWVARARRLAERLARDPRLIVGPLPPPTGLFHIYLRGDVKALETKRNQIAREHGIWVTHRFYPTSVPGHVHAELHLAAESDAIRDDDAVNAVLALLE